MRNCRLQCGKDGNKELDAGFLGANGGHLFAGGVSLTAMAYRLVERDVHPSLLVAYGKDGRHWFVRSKSIAEMWFPKDRLDEESGAYDILFGTAQDDRFMSTVEGDTWFDVEWADQIELGEQSFRTQENEVVSLLVARSKRMLAD